MNDLKFAFRQLLKNSGFTAVAVLTLALGIGANLALFTLLDEQFLRPRPVKRPEELWQILPSDASGEPKFFNFSPPYCEAIYKYNRVFKDLITIHGLDTRLRTSDGWEDRFGHIVSANYFNFVGVQPVLGRGFLPEDDKPGADLVAVMSYRFWQEQFLGNPAVVGKTVNLRLLSYLVKQRTREIGIRLAVGAQQTDVAKLILVSGLWLVLTGISLGIPPRIRTDARGRHVVNEDARFCGEPSSIPRRRRRLGA